MDQILRWCAILTAAGGNALRFSAGEMLFFQGDPCRDVGYVAAGWLDIRATTPDGRELPIQTVPEGEFFGDVLTFAGGTKYLGNVVAAAGTEVIFLDPEAFLRLLGGDAAALRDYLGTLGRKTFFIKQQVKMLSLPDLRSKLLFWLRWNLGGASGGTVPIPGTKERLAAFLAVERPSLSRELAHMKRDGLLDYGRTEIVLHDR